MFFDTAQFLSNKILTNDQIDQIIEIIKIIPWHKLSIVILCIVITLMIRFSLRDMLKRTIAKAVDKYYIKSNEDSINDSIPTVYILDKILTYFVIVLCSLISIRILGIKIGELTLLIGAISFAIVIGLQGFMKNFVSGLMILMENNVRIGDVIDLTSIKDHPVGPTTLAWVTEIRTRTTVLTTFDGKEIILPNSTIIENIVVNITLSKPLRRIHAPFFIPITSNIEDIKSKILDELLSQPYCLSHPSAPSIWIRSLLPTYIHCELVVWINQKRIKSSPLSMVNFVILKVLQENNAMLNPNNMKSGFDIGHTLINSNNYDPGF